MSEKTQKRNVTVRLPQWICDILNAEADIYEEKWFALSSAIMMWHQASPDQKAYYARLVREREIEESRQRDLARRGGSLTAKDQAKRIVRGALEGMDTPGVTGNSTPPTNPLEAGKREKAD